MKFSKWDCCQYLLSSPDNVTLTHLADPLEGFSHDAINRYLRGVALRPRHLWERVKSLLEPGEEAILIFDDTAGALWEGTRNRVCRSNWYRASTAV